MTDIPTRITTDWLRERGASCSELDVFAREWPDGATLTRANLLRAAELHLDLGWLSRRVLSAPAWAEYERVAASALADALGLPAESTSLPAPQQETENADSGD